jgi:protein-disulfide isomerase
MQERIVTVLVAVALLAWLPPESLRAQQSNDELKKEIEALKDTIRSIQSDLEEIKTLMRQKQSAASLQRVVLDLGDNPFKGARTARLTLVEFTDYQCPFCARYVRETYPQIEKDYVETGKLKYVVLDLPLEPIHRFAFRAAEAANCARDSGKYWEMHDQLFQNRKTLEQWTAHAQAVGIDIGKFDECLNSGKYAGEIRRDMAEARKAGVNRTPIFFLATTDPASSKVETITRLIGAQPYAAFKAEIDRLLAETVKTRAPRLTK